MTSLADLEELYKFDMTHHERAKLEEEIWEATGAEARRAVGKYGKHNYLTAKYGHSIHAVRARHEILSAPEAVASVLWVRVESGMTLGTAKALVASARRYSQAAGVSLEEAFAQKLAEHDAPREAQARAPRSERRARPVGPLYLPEDSSSPAQSRTDREFWTGIRSAIRDFVASRIGSAPGAEGTVDECTIIVSVMAADVQSRVRRARARPAMKARIDRGALESACGTLGVASPPADRPVDLTTAFKQRGRLARAYHPDRHGGSEETLSMYMAIMDAYRLLEEYNAGL